MPKKGGVPENLKPFTGKDDPRNGKKPKGCEHSSTRLKRILGLVQIKKNPITGKDEKFSIEEQMDMALVIKALKGDHKAYKELMDRKEGKPAQTIDQNVTVTNPVIIDWTDDHDKANTKAKGSKKNS